ncbi:MAG: hypothetical protein ACXVZ4_14475, partial [Gaiellaceae bacterium]
DVSVRRVCRRRRFRLGAGSEKATVNKKIAVSTAVAEFGSVPFYFATLELPDLQQGPLGPLAEVRASARDGFELHLRAADGWWKNEGATATVHWLGVERLPAAGGFEPDPSAVASPLDLDDEYAVFEALPVLNPPDPD